MIFSLKETRILKFWRLLLCCIVTSFSVYSQENRTDESIDSILEELFFNEKQFVDELIDGNTSFNFLYTSLNYNSNTFFSGRFSGVNQFNIIPQISYYHTSGFNASLSGVYYQNFDPHWDFTSATLGYLNTLKQKKNILYSIAYTRFYYSDGFDDFTNSVDISLGIRNAKQTLGSSLSFSYVFGSDTSYQIVSSFFTRLNLIRKSTYALRIRPTLNFIIAQQEFNYIEINRTRPMPSINFVTEDVFDLFNTQMVLPISFTVKSFDFELGYYINIPNPVANETNLPTTSFFNFSIGYLFDFKK